MGFRGGIGGIGSLPTYVTANGACVSHTYLSGAGRSHCIAVQPVILYRCIAGDGWRREGFWIKLVSVSLILCLIFPSPGYGVMWADDGILGGLIKLIT